MAEASPSLALSGCRVWRPNGVGGAVEVAVAAPVDRSFPLRMTQSLGVCLKLGGEHDVFSDGRWLRYPADAICVRAPGCIWSCASTGLAGFHSLDIDLGALPEGMSGGPMTFLPGHRLPEFQSALEALASAPSELRRQEAVALLVVALDGVIHAEALRESRARAAVVRARELLGSRLRAPPTLDELAEATGTNKFVLLRSFKRELGITPHRYVVALRLDRARELLARGVAVAEVAGALGFADQAHFTRAFRASVGITPGRYARQVRSMVGVP